MQAQTPSSETTPTCRSCRLFAVQLRWPHQRRSDQVRRQRLSCYPIRFRQLAHSELPLETSGPRLPPSFIIKDLLPVNVTQSPANSIVQRGTAKTVNCSSR